MEIDVEPLDAACSCHSRCLAQEPYADAHALEAWVNGGIEDECVPATVPGEIDEADELAVVIGAQVGEAVAEHWSKVALDVFRPSGREQ